MVGWVKTLLRVYATISLAFIFAPLLSLALMSFHAGSVPAFPVSHYSIRWYIYAWNNEDFRQGAITSLEIATTTSLFSTILALSGAYFLCRRWEGTPLPPFILLSLPCLIPPILSGLAILMYYERIRLTGGWVGIVLAHTCYCSPFALAVIRPAYQRLNIEMELAASNLGATSTGVMRHVVIPQLWPALITASLIGFLVSLDEFYIAWFVGGFTKTLPTVIYGMLVTSANPSLNVVGLSATFVSSVFLIAALTTVNIFAPSPVTG